MINLDGKVKIMDFGLAKVGKGTQVTKIGSTVGTIAYMSPEQAKGEELDNRTDIWSFGIVLYEMITGKQPFRGDYDQAVIYSILNEEPELEDNVSAKLKSIIIKALSKNINDRFQSITEMLTDLRGELKNIDYSKVDHVSMHTSDLQAKNVRSKKKPRRYFITASIIVVLVAVIGYLVFFRQEAVIDSIAALPLVNVNADPNTEYLTDGITESIINSLSQLPNLRVTPRSTAFRYKGKDIDLKEVGNTLNVQTVLTGRLVQHGDKLNIQIELIDIAKESQLWGAQYDRKLTDLITVQEEIVREVSSKLQPGLTGKEKRKLLSSSATNSEAYQLYLKGRYLTSEWTFESVTKGLEYLKKAVEIDPNFALGYAGLGKAYYDGTGNNYSHLEGMPKARESLVKALYLDDNLLEAHLYLAVIKMFYDWDWEGASKEFERTLELEPGNAEALAWHSWYIFYVMNRPEDALVEAQKVLSIDPLSQIANLTVGRFLQETGRYDEAIRHHLNMIEFNLLETYAELRVADCYVSKNMYNEALNHINHQIEKNGHTQDILVTLGWALGKMGNKSEALKVRNELLAMATKKYVRPLWLAVIDIASGEIDRAFDELQKAYEQRDEIFVGMYYWRYFGPIRNDPRFKNLAKKVGLPE
jgi:serine/threonine-protein kinase